MDKKIRGKWYKGFIFTAVFMICLIVLQGCDKNTEEKNDNPAASRGRYVERQVAFEGDYVLAFQQLEDGTRRIITDSGVYDSSDEGKSWKPWEDMPKELKEDFKEGAVHNAEMSRKGSIFWESHDIYKLMTPDGKVKYPDLALPPDGLGGEAGLLSQVLFTESGDILYAGMHMEKIYFMDTETLTVKHVFELPLPENSEFLQRDICPVGDKLYILYSNTDIGSNGVQRLNSISSQVYSLTDFEEEGSAKPLEQFLIDKKGDWSNFILLPGYGNHTLYVAGSGGIYRWQTEGTAIEKIFDGGQGQMLSDFVAAGTVLDQDAVMLCYESGVSSIYEYYFDPEAALQPETALTVYSLYENRRIRQAITDFQRERTDVWITYEVGLNDSGAVTRSDALKTLNTNIMAGEGPDILLLEGMPLQAYLEKEILLDISDVIKEAASTDGVFENIIGAYQMDGKICAVPTYFSLPVLLGKDSLLAKADSLEGLAAVAEAQRAAHPEAANVLGEMTYAHLIRGLIPSSSPAWIKQDGTLDKEKIVAFLEAAKRISDAQGSAVTELIGEMETEKEVFDRTPFMNDMECMAGSIGYSNAEITMGNLSREMGLSQMVSMANKLGDSSYVPFPGQAKNVFNPLEVVGISAKSKEPDTAKAFLAYLLGKGQFAAGMPGWPVNKTAFESLEQKPKNFSEGWINPVNDVDGSTYEMEILWPSKEDFNTLTDMIGTMKTPAVTDEIINRAVLNYGVKCLKGEHTPTEAADVIAAEVNLYLAK